MVRVSSPHFSKKRGSPNRQERWYRRVERERGVDYPVIMMAQYSCDRCGLKRVECEVPEREAERGIMEWMEVLTQCLMRDHHGRSPQCHPKELSEVLIPMTGRTHIGGPVVQ